VKRGSGPVPFVVLLAVVLSACGVKGPPLPPLVRLPAAPGELVAERRGNRVELHFLVPAENTDGSRPANIDRVDVYAITAPPGVSDDVILRRGSRIGSVDVKAPRDPNETVDPGEPISDVAPPEGPGVDQGTTAFIQEDLTAASLVPADLGTTTPAAADAEVPVQQAALSRTFVGVSISTRGRPGLLSRRAVVTLLPAPPAPPAPTVTYDETSIRLAWPVADATENITSAYHVYEVMPQAEGVGPSGPAETRLTQTPITEGSYVDKRLEWGVERCYTVRLVHTLDALSVESEQAPSRCVTLKDTFAPLAPTGLDRVPSAGAITLIWNPSSEGDLAGYVVLRGPAGSGTLERITPEPIQLTTYRDSVPPGVRFAYVVQAIDKSGNVSPESASVEETAR
jgi:hypothetical protein